MATVEDLKTSVAKAEEKVEKCKATIERHKKQLVKKIADVKRVTGKIVGAENIESHIDAIRGTNDPNYWMYYEVRNKLDDIKNAEKKLREAEKILDGWQIKLSMAEEKERFIAGDVPQVIKDFMEEWKVKAHRWHIKRLEGYRKLKEKLAREELAAHIEYVETTPGHEDYLTKAGKLKPEYRSSTSPIRNYVAKSRKGLNDFLAMRGLDYKNIERRKHDYAGAAVLQMSTFREEAAMLKWLDKQLEAEKKAKMLDLVQRVNDVVGRITDASHLSIGNKGDLNGIIIGTLDRAYVQTIGAGGYNIQCFHFRVLVHPADKVARKAKKAKEVH